MRYAGPSLNCGWGVYVGRQFFTSLIFSFHRGRTEKQSERSMMKENLGRRTIRGALRGIHIVGQPEKVWRSFSFPFFSERELHEGFVKVN